MRYEAFLLVISASSILCGACGDDTSGGPEFEELPALLSERLCPEIESCFDARTRMIAFGEAGCAAQLQAQLEDGDFAHVKAAIEDGRVSYDASQIEPCLDSVAGVGCEFASTRVFEDGACERVFEGSVALGGDCAVDAECTGEAFCRFDAECPGTCTALLGPGDACEDDDQCEDGLACPDEISACTALADSGDACGGAVAAPCRADRVCVGEDEDTGAAGTCRTLTELFSLALGEPCDLDAGELCSEGLSCVVTSLQGGMAEFECQERVDSGEACSFGVPSPCPVDEYCDVNLPAGMVDGTCEPLPRAGETCVDVAGAPNCAPGLFCDVDNRCHALSRLGQPCASDDGCASGECVIGSCDRPQTCTP